ncbi:MAG: NADPH-dependent glutamate synthase [Bacteroidales bacterium]|nr:NADPH-dependent glutamate synthase [Bacteroidales bacterium]
MLKALRDESWRTELRGQMKAKDRASIERIKMPEENPEIRNKSYVEVNKGITPEMAMSEARRCLDCIDPTCMNGCPVGVNIPKFLKYVEAGDFLGAARTIKETNSFPAICGRVCPQESQCEAKCMYPVKMKKDSISIGNLERFVADYEMQSGQTYIPEIKENKNIKVAVVGSGPAGLAVAGDLAKMGYKVTVFEALHEFGGVLKYGIPEFRLPNNIIDHEIATLRKMGVKFVKNFIVGKTASFDDLRNEGYKAFFVGSGAGLPKFMNIPGENYVGIMSANEYLTRINLMGANKPDYDTPVVFGKSVAVIGGGNTAMDSVRTAKRLGADRAMIIYRRSFDEMPARKEEIKHAMEEGVEFMNLTNPVRYIANEKGQVKKIVLQKMELGEPDSSGRRSPVPVAGSEYEIDIDLAVVAIGVSPNPLIPQSLSELETTRWQTIKVDDETMQSNISGIFAGGDIVRGGATVILAMGDGRKAAKGIDEYLSKPGK